MFIDVAFAAGLHSYAFWLLFYVVVPVANVFFFKIHLFLGARERAQQLGPGFNS